MLLDMVALPGNTILSFVGKTIKKKFPNRKQPYLGVILSINFSENYDTKNRKIYDSDRLLALVLYTDGDYEEEKLSDYIDLLVTEDSQGTFCLVLFEIC